MLKNLTHMHEDNEEGFSLVELLVVIVIIGILSAIAIGAFMNQRKKANDASLQADLRSISIQHVTWTHDNTTQDFIDLIPSQTVSMYAVGKNAVYGEEVVERDVKNIEGAPQYRASEGNIVEIVVSNRVTGTWERPHEEGEFCLIGSAVNSNYDTVFHGGEGVGAFDEMLYFDSKLGGVRTMDSLVEAKTRGDDISCMGHTNAYINGGFAQ